MERIERPKNQFGMALLFFVFVLFNLQTSTKKCVSRPFPINRLRAETDVTEIEVPLSDEKHLKLGSPNQNSK